ncbi:MAG TPA: M14 family metallopeptidase [Anaerolineales bacterium]|nr:M14 family metallopeptidase [Anaerolineales bacterium]
MPRPRFNKFYRYDELTKLLKAYVKEYPKLFQLESIGKSYEGRDVWLITATNFKSGADAEKPALWLDGNIHASEVTASAACLYFIHTLATKYGRDKQVTAALDTRVFYIVPRVNPDGAEWALADKPKVVRSSTRPYPYDEEPVDGLIEEDVDGDGRILLMRLPDPNGAWKRHPKEPRLLIRRDPTESGGKYYRVLPEGFLRNYDGVTIQLRSPKEGLDLNRNFPIAWRTESEQHGAGPYPTSEPEVHNLIDFIVKHKNITGAVSFHTFAALIMRPYDDRSDDEFPAEDLWTYKKIGEEGTRLTGYPNISVFHDFKYHPKSFTTGAFDTWMYDHLGIFAWTVEIWSPIRQAGIKNYKYIDWFREHPGADDLKILRWNDTKLKGKGYVNWYQFDHPQLGKVELGSWDWLHTWTNPPAEFLETEIKAFPKWLVWHALISPKLNLREAKVAALGNNNYRVQVVVENVGWLPSYVTQKALERKVRGLVCEIEIPKGAKLETGKARQEPGQLEGRAYKEAAIEGEGTSDRLKVEWIVHAPKGGKVKVVVRHERAGKVEVELGLK